MQLLSSFFFLIGDNVPDAAKKKVGKKNGQKLKDGETFLLPQTVTWQLFFPPPPLSVSFLYLLFVSPPLSFSLSLFFVSLFFSPFIGFVGLFFFYF